ncbi:hypothetical protein E4U15_006836 [Claviceps sp. LM218 group G6]|nr:hypothetical protein E4U15_006836 [Claviceps sp. LM218 group G6]
MESVLNTLRSLPLDMATHISPSDWDQLAAAFGTRGGDQTSDALSIFYDASGAKSRTLAQASDPHIFAGRTAQFGAKQGFLEFCYKQAVYIQNTILDFAREQTTKFDSCPIRLTFLTGDSAPRLTTSDYTTRFAYGAWTQLLNLTRDQLAIAIGSSALTFHQEWDSVVVPTVIPAEATWLPTPTLVELPYLLTRIVTNAKDQGCFEGVAGSTARTKIIHTLQEAINDLQKDVSSQGSSEGLESTTAANSTALPLRETPTRMRPEDERRISARAVDTRTTSTPMKKALPSSTGADTVETETNLIAWYIGGLEQKLSCQ